MTEHSPLPQLQCAQTSKGDWWLYAKGEDGVTRAYATTPDEGTARALVAAVNQAPLVEELVEAFSDRARLVHYMSRLGGGGHEAQWEVCGRERCATGRDLLRRVREAKEGSTDAQQRHQDGRQGVSDARSPHHIRRA